MGRLEVAWMEVWVAGCSTGVGRFGSVGTEVLEGGLGWVAEKPIAKGVS